MVSINNPMMDAEMDDQTRAYLGILERRNVGLEITLNKQKAIIEVLSGMPHEAVLKDMENKEVLDIVAQVIQNKNPDLSRQEARQAAADSISSVEESAQATPSAG